MLRRFHGAIVQIANCTHTHTNFKSLLFEAQHSIFGLLLYLFSDGELSYSLIEFAVKLHKDIQNYCIYSFFFYRLYIFIKMCTLSASMIRGKMVSMICFCLFYFLDNQIQPLRFLYGPQSVKSMCCPSHTIAIFGETLCDLNRISRLVRARAIMPQISIRTFVCIQTIL